MNAPYRVEFSRADDQSQRMKTGTLPNGFSYGYVKAPYKRGKFSVMLRIGVGSLQDPSQQIGTTMQPRTNHADTLPCRRTTMQTHYHHDTLPCIRTTRHMHSARINASLMFNTEQKHPTKLAIIISKILTSSRLSQTNTSCLPPDLPPDSLKPTQPALLHNTTCFASQPPDSRKPTQPGLYVMLCKSRIERSRPKGLSRFLQLVPW